MIEWEAFCGPQEARRVFVRQRPEQHGIDHGKNCGVCTDAQGQREDGDDGKTGIPAKLAEAVAEVLGEFVDDADAPGVAALFFNLLNAAQFDERLAARICGRHPGAEVILNVHLEMALKLLGHLALVPLPAEQVAKANQNCPYSSHENCSSDCHSAYIAKVATHAPPYLPFGG
jgi:hypothetical protein